MGHKAYYWNKIYGDVMICTKAKLIFFLVIAFFSTVSISFAEQNMEKDRSIKTEDLGINCKADKSKSMTIRSDTEKVNIAFVDGCCGMVREKGTGLLKERLKEALRTIFAYGSEVSYPEFLEHINSSGCNIEYFIEDALPVNEGASQDYSYECYTEDQLKAYHDKLVEFYEKLYHSEN